MFNVGVGTHRSAHKDNLRKTRVTDTQWAPKPQKSPSCENAQDTEGCSNKTTGYTGNPLHFKQTCPRI